MATATLIGVDKATRGYWPGVYGSEGYWLYQDPSTLLIDFPDWMSAMSATGNVNQFEDLPDTDARWLRLPAGAVGTRTFVWLTAADSLIVSITPADSATHRVALYVVNQTNGRSARARVESADGSVEFGDTGTIEDADQGAYVVVEFSGPIRVRFTSAFAPTFQGALFDPAPTPSEPIGRLCALGGPAGLAF